MNEITCENCKHYKLCDIYPNVSKALPNWLKTVESKNNLTKIYKIVAKDCPLRIHGPCLRCGLHREDTYRMLCVKCDKELGEKAKKDKDK